jgi:hypothetical protein
MSVAAKVAAPDHGAVAHFDGVDWSRVRGELDEHGFTLLRGALEEAACARLQSLYAREDLFRSRIVMARHGFGMGEYQYFAYPLPPLIDAMRHALYRELAPIANAWCAALARDERYPLELDVFLKHCHAQGQTRPTPLMLKYGAGDYNRLHQDLYGGIQFPLQATALLSAPGKDFEGGEFVLTESAPRRQTRAGVVPLAQGDMVVFAVNQRPVRSAKGFARVVMRHGVSTVRRGERFTLGIIFHDAIRPPTARVA